MARISLSEALSRPTDVDRAKLDATTETDIRRYQVEDGFAGPPAKRTFGRGLIEAAKQAIAIARGGADPSAYQVWAPKDGRMVRVDDPRVIRTGRVLSDGAGR